MDLNKIVQDYKISKVGGEEELKTLQERLRDVPVNLKPFEEELRNYRCEFNDMITRAELYLPQTKLVLLGDLVDEYEEDRITEQMLLPYTIILLNGESVSDNFYNHNKTRLGKLILPDKKDKTAKVLSDPRCRGAVIIFERNDDLHYIEMILTKDSYN